MRGARGNHWGRKDEVAWQPLQGGPGCQGRETVPLSFQGRLGLPSRPEQERPFRLGSQGAKGQEDPQVVLPNPDRDLIKPDHHPPIAARVQGPGSWA